MTIGEDEFTALVERHQPAVFRWAVALMGDFDDAEDVTQEVFVRAHRKLAAFRGDGSLEGWLYRITRRVVSRHRTKAQRRLRLDASPAARSTHEVYLTDPGARIDRENALALIREIVFTLPVRQREVFVLCDLQGRSATEVAAMLDMKDVSVRASLFKARTSIRRSVLRSHPRYQEADG
jgi:RNA polymerase sigma-70 factor (ECF subfamily)